MNTEQNMQPDITGLLAMADSPAGKKLLELVKQKGSTSLISAMNDAQGGNLEQAKDIIGSILSTPEAKKLIKELEGSHE